MKKNVSLVVVMLCVCTTAMAINVNRDIPFAATSPTLDGVIGAGEWSDALSWDVVYDDNLLDGGQLIGDPPTDAADSSYTVSMKWDNTNLYIAGDVADDVMVWNTKTTGMNEGDLLQLCLATAANPTTFLGDMGLYDFAFDTVAGNFAVYSHSWPELAFDNAQIGGIQSATGYTVELAIPWSDLDGYAPIVGDVHFTGFLTGDLDGAIGDPMTNLFDFGQTTGSWGALVDADQWNTITLVPEPATIFLISLISLGCLALRKRKV